MHVLRRRSRGGCRRRGCRSSGRPAAAAGGCRRRGAWCSAWAAAPRRAASPLRTPPSSAPPVRNLKSKSDYYHYVEDGRQRLLAGQRRGLRRPHHRRPRCATLNRNLTTITMWKMGGSGSSQGSVAASDAPIIGAPGAESTLDTNVVYHTSIKASAAAPCRAASQHPAPLSLASLARRHKCSYAGRSVLTAATVSWKCAAPTWCCNSLYNSLPFGVTRCNVMYP